MVQFICNIYRLVHWMQMALNILQNQSTNCRKSSAELCGGFSNELQSWSEAFQEPVSASPVLLLWGLAAAVSCLAPSRLTSHSLKGNTSSALYRSTFISQTRFSAHTSKKLLQVLDQKANTRQVLLASSYLKTEL